MGHYDYEIIDIRMAGPCCCDGLRYGLVLTSPVGMELQNKRKKIISLISLFMKTGDKIRHEFAGWHSNQVLPTLFQNSCS